ncbi:MAG: M56 family metallopeptidase, partial [Flavisolibacter sp.]
MANWSQSHFLQSLGWATLNSFWQMALLWCVFIGASYIFKISSHKKYQLSVLAIVTGFIWFLATFFYYFQSSPVSTISFFDKGIQESNSILNMLLLSASVAYLSLLIFPSYKLYRNWQFVRHIRKESMKKADVNYRLFVQKIAAQLGINKKVLVYLSDLVKSPMTIGYLKPIILLPVAALNHLSTQQVEAILLHELSHIRRYDYIVNLIISVINTILYFNPFVKQFMQSIEEERENCCDQLVLQFGYDKVGYASALLSLEKMNARQQVLAIGAAGKKYLLSRIEKIVGMEKKKTFNRNHFAVMLAAFFCILVFNSFMIIRDKKSGNHSFMQDNVFNPMTFFNGDFQRGEMTPQNIPATKSKTNWIASVQQQHAPATSAKEIQVPLFPSVDENYQPTQYNPMIVHVGLDDVDASLSKEEKEKVKSTVAATKKVISNMQWKEVEKNIADAMTDYEKVQAKQEYLIELDKSINWSNVEQN